MKEGESSFEDIMCQLWNMKQQLLELHYIYSPKVINFHQISQIKKLKQQVLLATSKLTHFQQQLTTNKQQQQSQQHKLQEQNSELLAINQQLVHSNERFKNMVDKIELEKNQLEEKLLKQQQALKTLELKHQKQIQNIKLMQAQQLYMLRKKQKKG